MTSGHRRCGGHSFCGAFHGHSRTRPEHWKYSYHLGGRRRAPSAVPHHHRARRSRTRRLRRFGFGERGNAHHAAEAGNHRRGFADEGGRVAGGFAHAGGVALGRRFANGHRRGSDGYDSARDGNDSARGKHTCPTANHSAAHADPAAIERQPAQRVGWRDGFGAVFLGAERSDHRAGRNGDVVVERADATAQRFRHGFRPEHGAAQGRLGVVYVQRAGCVSLRL